MSFRHSFVHHLEAVKLEHRRGCGRVRADSGGGREGVCRRVRENDPRHRNGPTSRRSHPAEKQVFLIQWLARPTAGPDSPAVQYASLIVSVA